MNAVKEWTPVGWIVDDPKDPWSFEEVIELHASAVKSGLITANGKKIAECCPDRQVTEVEQLITNMNLIRDCWTTDAGVWALVEMLFMSRIKTDPFWNPWSALDGANVKLDGSSPTKDGMNPANYRGTAGANGPHSKTGEWLSAAAEHGKKQLTAAVVPYRGDRWLWDHGMKAQAHLHFGRLHFHPPLSLPASSPSGCTIVPLFVPESKRDRVHPVLQRAMRGETARIPTELTRPNGSKYVRDVLITSGCASRRLDLFGLEGAAPSAVDVESAYTKGGE